MEPPGYHFIRRPQTIDSRDKDSHRGGTNRIKVKNLIAHSLIDFYRWNQLTMYSNIGSITAAQDGYFSSFHRDPRNTRFSRNL